MVNNAMILGYGCYYISPELGDIDKRISEKRGFVGYDDIPPIRVVVFLTKQARDEALEIISENFICGPLTMPIKIEPYDCRKEEIK